MRYDGRGTGFLRIREAVNKWDLPLPQFAEKTGYFRIRFVNPAIQSISAIGGLHLNERQRTFLKKFKGDKITTKDYVELMDCTKRTAIRDLGELVKLNLIAQRGPVTGRGRYYVLR